MCSRSLPAIVAPAAVAASRRLQQLGVHLVQASSTAEYGPVPAMAPHAAKRESGVATTATQNELGSACTALRRRMSALAGHELLPDVGVLVKAVEFAVRFGEWYTDDDENAARRLLHTAEQRLSTLENGRESELQAATGLLVRGYTSPIDGSDQPYGLEIPTDRPPPLAGWPLYVWLHGANSNRTDLRFIDGCSTTSMPGGHRPSPANALVIHPFGRHCVGYKWAGERDVLDAVAHCQTLYKIDPQRIILAGFSMGGAGVWHLAAHHPSPWCGVHTGAGFVETLKYNSKQAGPTKPFETPEALAATMRTNELKLLSVYDVAPYVRNLLHTPLIVYSGQYDAQMQAALVMQEAFEAQSATMPHLIGEGMGHEYHGGVTVELSRRLDAMVAAGRVTMPTESSLQTRTLRYNSTKRLKLLGMAQHWVEARLDATFTPSVTTIQASPNVLAFEVFSLTHSCVINGVIIHVPARVAVAGNILFARSSSDQPFALITEGPVCGTAVADMRKVHGLQGPIDDVFMGPFMVVAPDSMTGEPANLVNRWVASELEHFIVRWAGLFRGEARLKKASEVTNEDKANFNLIIFVRQRIASIHLVESAVNPVIAARPQHSTNHQAQPTYIYLLLDSDKREH